MAENRPLLSGLLQSERALPIIDGLKYTYKMKKSKEEIKNLMDYYSNEMLLHSIKMMLED